MGPASPARASAARCQAHSGRPAPGGRRRDRPPPSAHRFLCPASQTQGSPAGRPGPALSARCPGAPRPPGSEAPPPRTPAAPTPQARCHAHPGRPAAAVEGETAHRRRRTAFCAPRLRPRAHRPGARAWPCPPGGPVPRRTPAARPRRSRAKPHPQGALLSGPGLSARWPGVQARPGRSTARPLRPGPRTRPAVARRTPATWPPALESQVTRHPKARPVRGPKARPPRPEGWRGGGLRGPRGRRVSREAAVTRHGLRGEAVTLDAWQSSMYPKSSSPSPRPWSRSRPFWTSRR
jgi:hypothetical protein